MQTLTLDAAPSHDFRNLTRQVRAAGLLEPRLGYYGAKIVATVLAFGAGWTVFVLIGPSWATLGVAMFLGAMSTQLGFLGHDAGHGQIFASERANRLVGLTVGNGLIGLSLGWWVPKHNAHHAHPNEVGRDPDVGGGPVGAWAIEAQSSPRRRLAGWFERWQAVLFFPLMLLRSTGLYVSGVRDLLRRRDRGAVCEGLLLLVHAVAYLTAVVWVLPPLEAIAFIAVHQGVFSLYLGFSFAPNHKGMPLVGAARDMGFARRQVVTARNVTGGRYTTFAFGGLNYQIEHHLFPTMPRPNLSRARNLVRAFCLESDLGYCEATLLGSFRQIVRHLRTSAPL